MRKYDPLRDYLATACHPVEMTFVQMGRIVGGLPPRAFRWSAWWANSASHVQAKAWLENRRLVARVDLAERRVTFS